MIDFKDGNFRYGFVDFSLPEPLENVQYIDVIL